jgi:hypothetical protein
MSEVWEEIRQLTKREGVLKNKWNMAPNARHIQYGYRASLSRVTPRSQSISVLVGFNPVQVFNCTRAAAGARNELYTVKVEV